MAKRENGTVPSSGSSVAELAKQTAQSVTESHKALLGRREEVIGAIQSAAGDLRTIDSTLAQLGFNGELSAPVVDFGNGVAATATKRRGRKNKGQSASVSDGARGSKPMPLPEAICHALATNDNGLPKGAGMGLQEIAEAVQSAPVNYPFSGNDANRRTLISQRMAGLIEEGSVEQVEMEGRSRGLPYRLTSAGLRWTKNNPIGG